MNSFYCPYFRDMSHMWHQRSSLTHLSPLLIPSQFPLIPSHDLKTTSNHSYMMNFTPQNGVTQGVQGCFPVICNICDVWCVMCDVWCDMWCDKTYRTCHTYHTWHTVKISAKLVSNWPSNCCLSLCCIFLRHPLYFEATNRCLKKSKVAYFWEKLKKVKTYSSVFCKCGELYVFTFFNFSQKYATFDFFRHLLFLLTLVEFMTFWTEFTE